jgi:hypothetical protein
MLNTIFIENLEVHVDPQLILAIHGYNEKRKPGEAIVESVTAAAEAAGRLANPKAIYQEFQVKEISAGRLLLENNSVFNVGKTISGLWCGSSRMGIALFTLGMALEDRVSELLESGQHSEALNLDIAGTIALGAIGFQVQYFACEKSAAQGVETGPWLNPGYGEWPLADQRLLFDLVPASSIDVTLNEQCMMVPKKSVTTCSGIGITQVHDDFIRCQNCGVAKCPYRRLTVTH